MKTFAVVVFTGGEPTLMGRNLASAIRFAHDCGFTTRIVTNAIWATSPKKAAELLGHLSAAGLSELNFSVDDAHQEHIPLERVKWACEAASHHNLPVLIAAKGLKNSRITSTYLENYFGAELHRHVPGCKIEPGRWYYSYGCTIPVGWNADKLSDIDLLWPTDANAWKGPCNSVLRSVVVHANGDASICCGIGSDDIPETVIGNVHKCSLVEMIATANDDLIVNWLAIQGPEGIMKFVHKIAPEVEFKETYVGICHACHDVLSRPESRRVIASNLDAAVPALSLERARLESDRSNPVGTQNERR